MGRTLKFLISDQRADTRCVNTSSLIDLIQCAREESNFHGLKRPLGPQPSASTNSATCAYASANLV